jgi:hypothetical protein
VIAERDALRTQKDAQQQDITNSLNALERDLYALKHTIATFSKYEGKNTISYINLSRY